MTIFQAIILGIVEGITEFLPVSSTFHLIWASKLLNIAQSDSQKLFEVVIQAGAILAVGVVYINVLRKELNLVKKIIVSFFPTALIGLALYKIIKGYFFDNYTLQLAVFVAVGLFFVLFEKIRPGHAYSRLTNSLTYAEALGIGTAQALAVIPGVSRAGAVIVAMMFLDFKRDEAAKYSFLLAVPTILSAAALDVYKSREVIIGRQDWLLISIGFVAAFISALVVVKWLIKFLHNHTVTIFGWYRIILAIVLISVFWR